MKTHRPVNLNLLKFRFPIAAIVSILHRISGVIVFLLIPFLLWVLAKSLASQEGFLVLKNSLMQPGCSFILWVVLSAMLYHLVAGIRHLIMDMGYGESNKVAQFSAVVVMVISAILIILAGVWIWLW